MKRDDSLIKDPQLNKILHQTLDTPLTSDDLMQPISKFSV